MELIYLACPYSHDTKATRERRYRMSCIAAAKLMQTGIAVFNPLANSVPAVEFGGLDLDHAGFLNIDLTILRRCDELLVLGIEGWEESLGVRQEIFEAMALQKPITVIDEADIEGLPNIPKSARRFLVSNILKEVADG